MKTMRKKGNLIAKQTTQIVTRVQKTENKEKIHIYCYTWVYDSLKQTTSGADPGF